MFDYEKLIYAVIVCGITRVMLLMQRIADDNVANSEKRQEAMVKDVGEIRPLTSAFYEGQKAASQSEVMKSNTYVKEERIQKSYKRIKYLEIVVWIMILSWIIYNKFV